MPDIKLARLPDRTPVKITITVSPQLAHKLTLYAELYNNFAYPGSNETVAGLIPYMLESFLESDRNFVKAFKAHEANGVHQSPLTPTPRRKRRTTPEEPTPASEV